MMISQDSQGSESGKHYGFAYEAILQTEGIHSCLFSTSKIIFLRLGRAMKFQTASR